MHAKKQERKREKKWLNHLELFPFHTLEEPFHIANPWSSSKGEEVKPFKFERNMRALRRSLRGEKEDGIDSSDNLSFSILNWTCSVVTIPPLIISHFQGTTPSMWLTNQCTDPSMWLTTNLRRMLIAKFFSSSTHEDHETSWLQNPMTYKHSSFFKRNMN